MNGWPVPAYNVNSSDIYKTSNYKNILRSETGKSNQVKNKIVTYYNKTTNFTMKCYKNIYYKVENNIYIRSNIWIKYFTKTHTKGT